MATSVTSVTKHFPSAQNGFTTTTSGSVASGAATVGLNSVAGYTNGETAVFVIDPSNTKKQTFTGVIDTSGVQVTGVVWTAGTNVSHDAGATVVDYETATHWNMITKGLLVSHNQDGTLKDDSVTTANITDANVTTVKLADASVTPAKRSGGFKMVAFTVSATGSFSVTGAGFTPKFVTVYWLPPTSTVADGSGYGFSDGTLQYSTYGSSSTSNAARESNTGRLAFVGNTSGTILHSIQFTAFTSDGMTCNATTATGSNNFMAVFQA